MSEPVLVVDGLTGRIGGQQVVEDVSFEVPASGITALLGRNGVGKTSTIKSILGLIERTGEVRLAEAARVAEHVRGPSPISSRAAPSAPARSRAASSRWSHSPGRS